MKLVSVGCGYIGAVLAEEIVRSLDFESLIICDNERQRIKNTARKLGEKVHPLQLDISKYSNLLKIIDDADFVIGLSPGRLGFSVMKACVEKQKSLVDLSYMVEDPFVFHEKAVESGVIIVPDCGVAPGLSNILIGKATSQLDDVEDVIIYVGGLPQKLKPPLDYKVTWCVEDLFEEYTRKSRIVRNGEIVEVGALEGLEEVEFKELGKFEAFFTDGVRTLHYTIKAKNMWEKTLRYKGHAEKIKFLIKMGLLTKEPLKTMNISPWEFMCKFWGEKLSFVEEKDFILMNIKVAGRKGLKKIKYTFRVLDYFNEESNITAMGRTTAYTAFTVIKLLTENKIKKSGLVPPEILGMNKEQVKEIEDLLNDRNVKIREKIESF